jgi:hypothetical protein
MLYKYPQAEYPYTRLVEENRYRGKSAPEFELIDTGLFDDNRYFDVFVEYAKASADDILIEITVHNRGPKDATLHLLPQAWFRNTWSWTPGTPKPAMRAGGDGEIQIEHADLGRFALYADGAPELLFCDNETNAPRLYGAPATPGRCFKDGFHEYIVHGDQSAVSADRVGTKATAHYTLNITAGGSQHVRLRLRALTPSPGTPGEGRGEGDSERRATLEQPNHPHPNPLPEYRERGPGARMRLA